MKSFGVTEARKRWSELLAKVEGGDEILITRKGKTIARLVAAGASPEDTPDDAVVPVPGEKSVRDMIEEA